MKDLEKKIEEASYSYVSGFHENKDKRSIGEAFRRGAKSSEAKEYWQQGMYSEEDMLKFSFWLLNNIGETSNDKIAHFEDKYYLNKWFEQNKKKDEKPIKITESCPIGSYEAENKVAECCGTIAVKLYAKRV